MDCDEVSNDNMYISISSPDSICKSSSRVSNEHGTPVCVLTIPNQLLLDWNDSNMTIFVSKVNGNINEIITETGETPGECFSFICTNHQIMG